jgi:Fe-S oxidoreductase
MSDAVTRETTLCTFCPKMCRFACPVAEAEATETVTPWGLMTLLGLAREGRLAVDAEVGPLFHRCTGCLRCQTYCAHGNTVPRALAEGRRMALEAGVEPPAVAQAARRLRETGNVKGQDLAARQRELLGDRPARGARTLFFAGCEALAHHGEALVDAVRVLEHLGFGPVAVLEDAPCSGKPWDSTGHAGELRDHAARMAQRLNRFALVVSSCPGCVHTFRVLYAAVGAAVTARVAHLVELVVERMPKRAPSGLRVAYHDPCHLGRGLGVYEPPRELLRRAGAEVLEWFDCGPGARCSGGGNGFPRISPETAREIAARRVSDLPGAADVVATACPTCATQLTPVSPRPVVDVATLLARALGVASGSPGPGDGGTP